MDTYMGFNHTVRRQLCPKKLDVLRWVDTAYC